MINKLLIDLDGTLLDFNKGERNAFIETIKKFTGYDPTDFDCQKFSVINEHYFNEYRLGKMDRDTFHHNRFKDIYEYLKLNADIDKSDEYYVASLKYQANLFDDVLDCLKYLYKKYDLYVASNGMTEVQKKRLETAGIDKYFKKLYVSEAIGYNKPDIEFFNYIFNDLNESDKLSYAIIGDRLESDILGGINAGIITIYLERHEIVRDDIKPTYTISSLDEIYKIL